MPEAAITEEQARVLRQLVPYAGGSLREDHIGGSSPELLAAMSELGLVEHIRTRPMLSLAVAGQPATVEPVAIWRITDAGRFALRAYRSSTPEPPGDAAA